MHICRVTAKITLIFMLQSAVHIYDFHIFTVIYKSLLISNNTSSLKEVCFNNVFIYMHICRVTAKIALIFMLQSAVHIYDFPIFTVIY